MVLIRSTSSTGAGGEIKRRELLLTAQVKGFHFRNPMGPNPDDNPLPLLLRMVELTDAGPISICREWIAPQAAHRVHQHSAIGAGEGVSL